ncbi:Uncharacterised protein [Enterobacter cloacae]|nr:Uncharacterised protein [Enterobacter cloacae]
MLVKIIKQLAQALALPQLSHRSAKLLGLRAVPMGRDHQPTRHAVCRFNTVIPAHHVQAQINPRGAACGSENIAFVLVQHILNHGDSGIACFQSLRVAPVGGCLPPVKQA